MADLKYYETTGWGNLGLSVGRGPQAWGPIRDGAEGRQTGRLERFRPPVIRGEAEG